MKDLSVIELSEINGGTDWHSWAVDTAAECACAAAALSEIPPAAAGLAAAGAVLAGGAAIYDAWN